MPRILLFQSAAAGEQDMTVDPDQMKAASDSLSDALSQIDAGGIEATPGERAYIAGAAHALNEASLSNITQGDTK